MFTECFPLLFKKKSLDISNNPYKETISVYSRVKLHGDESVANMRNVNGNILSSGADHVVNLYDFENHKQLLRYLGNNSTINDINSVNDIVVSGSRDGVIRVWKQADEGMQSVCEPQFQITDAHNMSATSVALNKDGALACSGSRDTSVTLTDLTVGHTVTSKSISRNIVTGVAWCKDSSTVVQTSEDKSIKIWDTRSLTLEHQLPIQQHIHTSLDVKGDVVVTGSRGTCGNGAVVTLWDLRMLNQLSEYTGHMETVSSVRFLPCDRGTIVVSSSFDSSVRIWTNEHTYKEMQLNGTGQLTDFDLFSDNRMCVSTFKDGVYCLQYDNEFNMKILSLL